MPTTSIDAAPKGKPRATKSRAAKGHPVIAVANKSTSRPKPIFPKHAVAPPDARTTKQDRVLTMLSRPDGVSVEEIMATTGWQMHSVRGFLAGTVKKKLGFDLASTKSDGEVRRYRIERKRGR